MRAKGAAALAHWIDETLPVRLRDVLVANGIEPEQFAARIAPVVGRYRSAMHIRANMSQPSEDAEYVRRLRDALAVVRGMLDAGAMPARVRAALWPVLLRIAEEDAANLIERVERDASLLRWALAHVAQHLNAHAGNPGRKPATERAHLYGAIVAEIERQTPGTRKRARIIGLEALDALGIDAPSAVRHKAAALSTKRRVRK